jgi:uncharacterized membrane protein YphA (DoxX/SURF4 family)
MVLFRIVTGGVFVFSGFIKLISPSEEFAEVIRSYQLAPESLLYPLALVIPWIEVLSGAFLVLGLFSRTAAALVAFQLAGFMTVLSIVIATGIDLEDCGCFAALGFKETPLQALIRDAVLLAMVLVFIFSRNRSFSLDSLSEGKGET